MCTNRSISMHSQRDFGKLFYLHIYISIRVSTVQIFYVYCFSFFFLISIPPFLSSSPVEFIEITERRGDGQQKQFQEKIFNWRRE